jgi:four helix bundle protein
MNQDHKRDEDKKDEYLFDFEKSELYQRSMKFLNRIYDLTKKYPQEEKRMLCYQLKRSALSINLNLAEGFGKYYKREKKQYYRTARASVKECVPGLRLSLNQSFINNDEFNELYLECFELSRRISGLINYIDSSGDWDLKDKK